MTDTTTVYECIYCDFWTEDEQDYNRHMLEHQEATEQFTGWDELVEAEGSDR